MITLGSFMNPISTAYECDCNCRLVDKLIVKSKENLPAWRGL